MNREAIYPEIKRKKEGFGLANKNLSVERFRSRSGSTAFYASPTTGCDDIDKILVRAVQTQIDPGFMLTWLKAEYGTPTLKLIREVLPKCILNNVLDPLLPCNPLSNVFSATTGTSASDTMEFWLNNALSDPQGTFHTLWAGLRLTVEETCRNCGHTDISEITDKIDGCNNKK